MLNTKLQNYLLREFYLRTYITLKEKFIFDKQILFQIKLLKLKYILNNRQFPFSFYI